MQAEIIAVGSELLTPDRIDTNSLFLTQRLNHLGIAVARKDGGRRPARLTFAMPSAARSTASNW